MHLIEDILRKTNSKKSLNSSENEIEDKVQKLLVKMDEIENENLILVSKLQDYETEKEELINKCIELNETFVSNQELIKKLKEENENIFSKVYLYSIKFICY